MKFNLAFLWVCLSVLGMAGCSGGSSSFDAADTSDASEQSIPVLVDLGPGCEFSSAETSEITGKITFDRVPLDTGGALDFPLTTRQPARRVLVEALCDTEVEAVCDGVPQTVTCSGALSFTATNELGNYTLQAPVGVPDIVIRARAQMYQVGTPGWDVKVLDEQQAAELVFAINSSPFNVSTTPVTLNLHARSGSDGTSYTSARIAAPFAILDTVYKSMQLVMQANPSAVFPPLKVKWSTTSSDGSFYSDRTKTITLLGSLTDTDEFDEHVVAHEWGHYFQDAFSRDDSIGGPHSGGDILDIRVAFSEGFGNAFSAMVLGDPIYRDSQGLTAGFSINIENNNCNIYSVDDVDGWYNECSVQSVLYDLYDISNEGGFDIFDLGFDEIYQVLVDADKLRDSDAFTSLFSFINAFKRLPAMDGLETSVDNLLNEQSINVSIIDGYGTGATAAGGGSNIPTPPYLPGADVFSGVEEVCSSGRNGGYNGLGVSRYVSFSVPSSTNYTITAQRATGLNPADPDMYLYHKGELLAVAETWRADTDSLSASLQVDKEYVLEVREYGYTDPSYDPTATGATNTTCFTVTRTP